MAQFQGTVVSIALETDVKKNGGGTYKGWELVYRTSDGEVRATAKPVQGLRYNATLKEQLEALEVGDDFTLTQEKNDNGFWDVKTVEKGHKEAVPQPTAQKGSSYQPRAKSTYETSEERAARQRLIVRQSSLTAAIAILPKPTKEGVLDLAEELTSWVFEEGQVGLDNMKDDIPN